jgi:putative membrane-bound dehydrogenase-like protein
MHAWSSSPINHFIVFREKIAKAVTPIVYLPMNPIAPLLILTGIAGSMLGGNAADAPPLPKKLPAGLKANIFATPPMVNYPTFLEAAPNGDVYVAVDKNGSLDTKPDRGFIYKLRDTNNDGVADDRTVFADKVVSPRGLVAIGDTVICLHPPELEAFRDKDGDGIAEERTVLIKGIGFDLTKRAPDHTSNGVTLGIDGWLYLAIGDFGFMEAEGKDGTKLQLRAGGVIRVRPDGTGMEVFAYGTRNIYEVAVDPWLNSFARDNTNDGGGWDTRVEFYLNGVDLGYPRKFKHFTDETFPVLGIYGGGSGVGAVYVQEKGFGWPKGYDDVLYTCDWGRSAVYRHELKDQDAAFAITQDTFFDLERVTDMKVDAKGNAYAASWKGASFTYAGENVGYIVRISPEKPTGKTVDLNLTKKSPAALVADLTNADSHTLRLAASQEILRRQQPAEFTSLLEKGAHEGTTVPARIAAMFTLKQLLKEKATPTLIKLSEDAAVREFAIRAMGDAPKEGAGVPTALLVKALQDPNDHVKAQAVIALGRLGRKEAAAELLKIAARANESNVTADPEPRANTGNVKKTKPGRAAPVEADLTGGKVLHLVVTDAGDGNGTDHANWMEPRFVGPKGEKKLTDLKWISATQGWGATLINKSTTGGPLMVDGKPVAYGIGTHSVSLISYAIPEGMNKFVAQGGLDDAGCNQGDGPSVQFQVYVDDLPAQLRGKSSGAEATYTDTTRALPHIASRMLIQLQASEASLQALQQDSTVRSAALRVLRQLHNPSVVTGLIEHLNKTTDDGFRKELLTALVRLRNQEGVWDGSSWGTRPDTTGPFYKRDPWSETDRIDQAVAAFLEKANEVSRKHLVAQLDRHRVQIKGLPVVSSGADPQWAKDQESLLAAMQKTAFAKIGDIGMLEPAVAIEQAMKVLADGKADAKNGKKLFVSQGCIACHAVGKNDAPKGPNLYDIALRYKPEEVMNSIINPSATVSQGFPTYVITTKDGEMYSGFALKESGDEIVLRNMAALTQVIPLNTIKERKKEEHISSMTPGLMNNVKPQDMADLIEYFKSIK